MMRKIREVVEVVEEVVEVVEEVVRARRGSVYWRGEMMIVGFC